MKAVFVGAHPDDIELGAGCLVARLGKREWSLLLVVLSDEGDPVTAKQRRREASAAAKSLGLDDNAIRFCGFPDGSLKCDEQSVRLVRSIVGKDNLRPDLVVTHTMADDHQDHRTAAEITFATFRESVVLEYGIANSLRESEFRPGLFVDCNGYTQMRTAALSHHASQRHRIDSPLWREHRERVRAATGSPTLEAFEVKRQLGASVDALDALSDSAFHRFWSRLSPDLQFLIMYGSAPQRDYSLIEEPYFDASRSAVAELRDHLSTRWYSAAVVGEESSYSPRADSLLRTQACVVLVGGPVANRIVREYVVHFPNLRYTIDYTMPDYGDVHILDRETGQQIRATYETNHGTRTVKEDVALLTIMPNPTSQRDPATLVGAAGIHVLGTTALLYGLADEAFLGSLGKVWPGPDVAFQALCDVDQRGQPMLLAESLFTE